MRVLNIMSRFNVGGTSQWLFQLSSGLEERAIENLLLIGDCPPNEEEDNRLVDLNHKKIPGLGPKSSIVKSLSAFISLRREISYFQPDIINTHTSKAGALGRLAAWSIKSKAKVVHTYHGHVFQGYFNRYARAIVQILEFFLSFITDSFFVSGEQIQDDLKRAKIIRKAHSFSVWPAVPEIQIGNRDELRSSLGISSEEVVIGWLGRKVSVKRLDRILRLALARPEYTFIIAGVGESIMSTFSEYFNENNLENVIELGKMTPADFWAIADICLLTSDNEAMPIAPIEAALCGRPVIATNAGSTREVVIDGQTGFICSKELADILIFIDRLVESKEERLLMGNLGHNFASSRFTPQSSIDRQLLGYLKCLEN